MSFPNVIDNTIRKAFVGCPRQAFHRHVQNLRPMGPESVDLHFGGCFATGCEVARKAFYQNVDTMGATTACIERGIAAAVAAWGDFVVPADKYTFKTLDRLVGALRFYFEQWPLGADGLTPLPNGIECTFYIEIPVLHPDTKEWLRYGGRYDMIAKDARRGRLHIVDEKTTGKLGDSWSNQWDLDAQMTGYTWSKLHELGYVVGDAGTWPDVEVMAQIRGIAILKSGYGHVEVPIVRPAWMIDRWYAQMLRDVNRMVTAYQADEWDVALHGGSCMAYGRPCDYTPLCLSPNPDRLVDGNYQTVVWNPIGVKS